MQKKEVKENIKELLKSVIPAFLLAWVMCTFIIANTVVPSGSMENTIPIGSRVIGNRLFKYEDLKRGDIVIFQANYENKSLIKRLIGMPGDIVELIPDEDGFGHVKINGEKYEEDYLKESMLVEEYRKFEVPEGKYLFFGDNRNESYDARFWEDPYVDQEDIIAVAVFSFFPKIQKF